MLANKIVPEIQPLHKVQQDQHTKRWTTAMNTKQILALKNSPVGLATITLFCIAINATKYQAPAYLFLALMINGQYASHAIMFVANNKTVEDLITGMFANYADPSQ
jgi:hypothetical protein